MPIYLSSETEQLRYTPDQFATQGMQPGVVEAVQALVAQVQAMEQALQRIRATIGADQAQAIVEALALELAVPEVLQATVAEAILDHSQDATFLYHRIPSNTRAVLIQKHTQLGLTAWEPFWWDMGYEALTGWDNVLNADGANVPFSKGMIQYLPGFTVGRIGTLADNQAPLELVTKNWHGTLNGTAPLPG